MDFSPLDDIKRHEIGTSDQVEKSYLEKEKYPNSSESTFTQRIIFNKEREPCIVSEILSLGPSSADDCSLAKTTLEHALRLFRMPYLLQNLDKELKEVRKREQTVSVFRDHLNYDISARFEELFFKFDPDKWKQSTKALEWQKGVTLIWGALIALYNRFIAGHKWMTSEFKFRHCSKLEVGILNNDDLLNQVTNLQQLLQLCWLTSIKHDHVIPHIEKFLQHSHIAIQNFVSNENRKFTEAMKLAMDNYDAFLTGFRKLVKSLRLLYKICEKDANMAGLKVSVWRALVNGSKRMRWMTQLKVHAYSSYSLFQQEFYESSLEVGILEYTHLLFVCRELAHLNKQWGKTIPEVYYGCDQHGLVNYVNVSLLGKSLESPVDKICTTIKDSIIIPQISAISNRLHKNAPIIEHSTRTLAQSSENTGEASSYHNANRTTKGNQSPTITDKEASCLFRSGAFNNYILMAKSETLHHLFQNLASYICHGTTLSRDRALKILNEEFDLPKVSMNEEMAQLLFLKVMKEYSQYLQNELVPSNVFKDFEHEVEKALDSFAFTLRRVALEGLQQVSEEQQQTRMQLTTLDAHLEAYERKAEEIFQYIGDMEKRLEEEQKNFKEVEKDMKTISLSTGRKEIEARKGMEKNTEIEEKKLRERVQEADRACHMRLARTLEKLGEIDTELQNLMEK